MTNEYITVILVRHGQTDGNLNQIMQGQLETPLNKTGLLQAQAIGKRLVQEEIKLDALWTSDLTRCKQTSKLLLTEGDQFEYLQEVTYQSSLRERWMGELQGMKLSAAYKRASREGKTIFDYGESLKASTRRHNEAYSAIIKESIEKNYNTIMVVGHGADIKLLCHDVKHKNPISNTNITIKNMKCPHNASLSILKVNRTDMLATIISFGDVTHLKGKVYRRC